MPDNIYDYNLANLRQEIEDRWNSQMQAGRQAENMNGIRIGMGSWTSPINKSNIYRRPEYMQALENATGLARQDRQQALQERREAFEEASNYANAARLEKERQDAIAERERQMQFMRDKEAEERRRFEKQHRAQQEQFGLTHGLSQRTLEEQVEQNKRQMAFQKEQFEEQKRQKEIELHETRIARNIAMRQAMLQHQLKTRRISWEIYKQQTELNMKHLEAQGLYVRPKDVEQVEKAKTSEEVMETLVNLIREGQNRAKDMNQSGVAQQGLGAQLYGGSVAGATNLAGQSSQEGQNRAAEAANQGRFEAQMSQAERQAAKADEAQRRAQRAEMFSTVLQTGATLGSAALGGGGKKPA